jgi:hypothetical protein
MSETQSPPFRRLILELALGPVNTNIMRLAAEFARDFGLDLHGVYIEDESLLNLAGLPFAREIRLPTNEWRTLDAGDLASELRQHAEDARRRLRQVLDQMGLRGGFEVRRGDPMLCVAGVCSPSDIIMVTGVATVRRPNLEALRHAAALSPASVLMMPERPARRGGPIVVITDRVDGPEVAIVARFAATLHAPLLVLLPDDSADALGRSEQHGGVEIRAIPSLRPDDLLRALGQVRERLIVFSHGAAAITGMEGASRIAASVAVPVLVL